MRGLAVSITGNQGSSVNQVFSVLSTLENCAFVLDLVADEITIGSWSVTDVD